MDQLSRFANCFHSDTLDKFIENFGSTDRDCHVTDFLSIAPANGHELLLMSLAILLEGTRRTEKRDLRCELSISIDDMWIGKARKLEALSEVSSIILPYGAYGPPEIILFTALEGFVGLSPDRLLSSKALRWDLDFAKDMTFLSQFLQFEDFDPEEGIWRMYPCVRVQACVG